MKKLFLIFIASAFCGATIAQEKPATIAKPATKDKPAAMEKTQASDAGVKEEKTAAPAATTEQHNKFECPKCHMTSEKPGKCSMCQVDMIEAKAEMKKEKAEMKHEHGKGDKHGDGKGDGKGHEKKTEE